MTDYHALKAKMYECGYIQKTLAKELKITPTAFFNRAHDKSFFTTKEVGVMIKKLHLTSVDVMRIFFSKKVN